MDRKTRAIVYRAPRTSFSVFLDELSDLLDNLQGGCFVILGDLNCPSNDTTSLIDARLLDILITYDLIQHVNQGTHDSGHMLDLIITPDDANIVSGVEIAEGMSDHKLVMCLFSGYKPPKTPELISRRQLYWEILTLINSWRDF